MRIYVDTSKTCSHCGTDGLEWREIDGKWKLVDLRSVNSTGFPHVCPTKKRKKK